MASTSIQGLEALLQSLKVSTPIPQFPQANVLSAPADIYRSYIAEVIQKLVDCDKDTAYDTVQWANAATNADLMLITARLKLKGINPKQLAEDIVSKVYIPTFNINGSITRY